MTFKKESTPSVGSSQISNIVFPVLIGVVLIAIIAAVVFGGSSKNIADNSSAPNNNRRSSYSDLGITADQFLNEYNKGLELLEKKYSYLNLDHLRIVSKDKGGSLGEGFIIKSNPINLEFYTLNREGEKNAEAVKLWLPDTMSKDDQFSMIFVSILSATINRRGGMGEADFMGALLDNPRPVTVKIGGCIFYLGNPSNARGILCEIVAENSEYAQRPGNAKRYRDSLVDIPQNPPVSK